MSWHTEPLTPVDYINLPQGVMFETHDLAQDAFHFSFICTDCGIEKRRIVLPGELVRKYVNTAEKILRTIPKICHQCEQEQREAAGLI